jgi:hypothetical protein
MESVLAQVLLEEVAFFRGGLWVQAQGFLLVEIRIAIQGIDSH